ncbi:Co-chaperone protein HscB [BD1-7 clade bacterium]|uniref:Co-chaperone protein HscB homolog n=1 Tax=BD1-7 clade bacterium TaxID=2029982 RepID=A0A5S9N4J0_9GAMM|nr:Co-chaperone protein HscB [BD1-7 clade bacterium]
MLLSYSLLSSAFRKEYRVLHTSQSYFELFGLSAQYDIDEDALSVTYLKLQRQFHPDKFAAATAQQQRVALQFATTINEAYECLKHPVQRAEYLMKQAGHDHEEHTMQSDGAFLFQQMEWREALEMASNSTALESIVAETQGALEQYQRGFDQAFSLQDYQTAQLNIDKMQFVYKFSAELQQKADSITEA